MTMTTFSNAIYNIVIILIIMINSGTFFHYHLILEVLDMQKFQLLLCKQQEATSYNFAVSAAG